MTGTAAEDVVAKHAGTLERALAAISERGHWSAFPESPSPRVYGEGAAEAGRAAYQAHLGRRFELDQAGTVGWVGAERSPYGPELGISYPQADLDVLLAAAQAAIPAWRDAGPRVRAAVCVEIVERVNARSFEIANAVMHTSGQAFVMAFQAGGPHAQDRALEAVAYAYAEQTRVPATARWEKPQGKRPPLVMEKTYTVVPRGVGAGGRLHHVPDLELLPRAVRVAWPPATPVVVKPHPAAILPLAITVAIARDVLAEAGFARDLVTLVAEEPGGRVAARRWPSGRRCGSSTSPGPPRSGTGWRTTPGRPWSTPRRPASTRSSSTPPTTTPGCWPTSPSPCLSTVDRCAPRRRTCWSRGTGSPPTPGRRSVERARPPTSARRSTELLGEDAQAVELLGAIVNDDVLSRVDGAAARSARWSVPSRAVAHPAFPDARVRTPAVVRVVRGRAGRVRRPSASARSPSWSPPSPPTRAWTSSAGR